MTSNSRECQITWDNCKDMDLTQTHTNTGGRVRRGTLRQEVESQRKRQGLPSLCRNDRRREAMEIESQDTGRKRDELDVFTSPFRALAERCGFKVIRDDDGSDSSSLRSQDGSLASDSSDVTCCEDQVSKCKVERVRHRRDTPRLDIHVKRAFSPEEEKSSSGEETDDPPGLSKGNLVLQKESLTRGKIDGNTRGHSIDDHKRSQTKDGWLKNDRKVPTRSEASCDDQLCSRNKTTYRVMKSGKCDQGPGRHEEKETPKDKKGQPKSQRRKSSNHIVYGSGKYEFGQYSSEVIAGGDCSGSTEEAGSTSTYRTVKEILSPEETDFYRTHDTTKATHNTDRSPLGNFSSTQRRPHDFNESSNFIEQEHQFATKPYSLRQQKIFMEKTSDSSPHQKGEHTQKLRSSKMFLEHDKLTRITKPGANDTSRTDFRCQPSDKESHDHTKIHSLGRTVNESDNQTAGCSHRVEQKRPGGGAAFRISRKLTTGTSCGVIRHFRTGHGSRMLDSYPKPKRCDFSPKDETEKSLGSERKHTADRFGAGDGNIPQESKKGSRVIAEKRGENNKYWQDKADTIQDGGPLNAYEKDNSDKTCIKKDTIENNVPSVKHKENEDRQDKQNTYYKKEQRIIKRGCDQKNGPSECDELEQDRDTVEKQVLLEIYKLRALTDQEQNPNDTVKSGNKDLTANVEVGKQNNILECGHGNHGQKEASSATQTSLTNDDKWIGVTEDSKPISESHGGCFNRNPLSPAPTDISSHLPSYIHLHGYREDDTRSNFYQEHRSKVDHLNSSNFLPRRSDLNHQKQNKPKDEYILTPASDAMHQEQNPEQKSPQSNTADQQPQTVNCLCCKQLNNQERSLTFCENLWKEPAQQTSLDPITLTGGVHTPKPTRRCMGDNTTSKTTQTLFRRQPEDNTTRNHGTNNQLQEHQPSQPQPQSLNHHIHSGFNINSNYEGDDAGENGMTGSRFIGQYFLELWKNQCLCDVRLRVGNWSYLAHKIVLAAFSDFFCPNDPHCMPSICFDIPNATPDAVHQILLYLYTSEMEITDYSLDSVLCAAESLGVSEVINLVKEILENPTPDNFDHYLDIRSRHGFPGRLSDYTDLIREHLLDLTNSPHFLEFEIDDLQQVLGDPEVKVDSEVDIIDVIGRWVEFNPMERIPYSADLLKFVNFDCIPAESLADVVERRKHVFSREAFSIFLDAFKARSVSAECPPCAQSQSMWPPCGIAQNTSLPRQPNATNKSANADIYRPQMPQQQQPHQQPPCYDFGETNATQNRTLDGGNFQESFRSPSKARRENSRIPRSCQNKISTLLGRGHTSGWASDAPTSRPSTGMSSRQSSAPRRFATTQSGRTATPKEIMSMASRGDFDQRPSWARPVKHHRVSRVSAGPRETFGAQSDSITAAQQQRGTSASGRRISGVYRCSNGNAVFSQPSDVDVTCGEPEAGALPVSSMGVAPLWDDSNPNTSMPTSPGWSRGSGGSFVASPWISPAHSMDSLPPGCSSFRVTRGGRGPRWEQRSRSPSAGQGSRDRSSSKRVTFMR
ncbi:kelch-like 31 [Elysia marginata]|uniref:Kelch-like 31 n=1 Tax=Elysia marginata TaxID=1093978 RepID=A0AAV4GSI4_9GAST|nr:kelch-like 31 [Elysia marginata]